MRLFPRIWTYSLRTFAIGNVAATDAQNVAGPMRSQAEVTAQNMVRMIVGDRTQVAYVPAVLKNQLTLGLVRHIYLMARIAKGFSAAFMAPVSR